VLPANRCLPITRRLTAIRVSDTHSIRHERKIIKTVAAPPPPIDRVPCVCVFVAEESPSIEIRTYNRPRRYEVPRYRQFSLQQRLARPFGTGAMGSPRPCSFHRREVSYVIGAARLGSDVSMASFIVALMRTRRRFLKTSVEKFSPRNRIKRYAVSVCLEREWRKR